MKPKLSALFIRVAKSFFLYTFAYVGIATMLDYFIFNEQQTEKQVFTNLISGVILSLFFVALKLEKRKEELSEDPIESN